MLHYVVPRILPPALALCAVLVVAPLAFFAWPEPWDEGAAADSGERELRATPLSFSAPLAGVGPLAQPVELTPVVDGELPRGFLVGEVRAGSLFARMGLQEGDVLLGIHDLGSSEAPHLVAHIERAGRALRVEYTVSVSQASEGP